MATKQARKTARKTVGKLALQVVHHTTRSRYAAAFKNFCQFHHLSATFRIPMAEEFDCMVAEYIEFLWEEGYPKSEASYALASIQFHRPQTKGKLVWSWKMVKAWNQLEMPTRATPLTPDLLLRSFRWRQKRLGWLLVLGFSGLLRTSELLNLRKKDVILPKPTQAQQEAILLIPSTKGTKRSLLPLDKVIINDALGIQALVELCATLQPGETLAQLSNYKFRKLWSQLIHELGLEGMGYQPYSLRRGAATSAFKQGMSLDALVTKGRWMHIPTARIYFDQGLQSMAAVTLPPATGRLCDRARQAFAVSQQGTRGRGE